MGRSARASTVDRRDIGTEIVGLTLFAFTAFCVLSVYSEIRNGAGSATNFCGPAGKLLGGVLLQYFGVFATIALLAVAAIASVCILFRVDLSRSRWKIAGGTLLVLGMAALEGFFFHKNGILSEPLVAGGFVGVWLNMVGSLAFGAYGLFILISLAVLVGLLLVTGRLVSPLVLYFLRAGGAATARTGKWAGAAVGRQWEELVAAKGGALAAAPAAAAATAAPARTSKEEEKRSAKDTTRALSEEDEEELEDDIADELERPEDEADDADEAGGDEVDDAAGDDATIGAAEGKGEAAAAALDGKKQASAGEAGGNGVAPPAAEKRTIQVIHRANAQEVAKAADFHETQLSLDGVYSLPPLTFLEDLPPPVPEAGRDELEDVALTIERTLGSFKIDARVENVLRGPVITQYEVSLAAGIKVHKIVSLSDDLAMALSAQTVRVVAPIPGKNAIGIEVPNRIRELVSLKEMLLTDACRESKARIPIMLGKDVAGTPIIEDLTRMPHLLLAGATGSGKSVCINSIILSILMTRTPDELKMILVDPKMVELSAFEEIPHLMTPVVTDMKKAPAALEWLCRKMDDRYELLAKAEVKNIASYNDLGKAMIFERIAAKTTHEEAEQAPERLPYIVIVIDELADLMMTASKEVESSIIRLSQKSRAVGIHMIVATQRPSVDVITGLIKANLPCRISFKVAGRVDSRTIIDRNGAERLLGQGDMLYLPPGTSAVTRAQSTFTSDKEVRKVCRFLRKEVRPEFSQEFERFIEGGGDGGELAGADDDLFDEAVRIILESQRGSVSLLQRRLGIGYTRASRLMDLMADKGLVGAFKGSKAREVYCTLEEWEAKQQQAG